MAKKTTPQITELSVTAILNGPTKNVAALRSVFDALVADDSLEPTHGGPDDRTRAAFDAGVLASAGARTGPSVWIWRRRRPRFSGSIDTVEGPVARARLRFEKVAGAELPGMCESILGVMDRLKPAYAAMHFAWSDPTPEHLASMTDATPKAVDYRNFGPPGVFAWTWFGPALAEQIGQGDIVTLGGQRRPWGGILLALDKEPWALPFEELRSRQVKADRALRAKGYFGDYEFPGDKGPRWEKLQ